MLKAYKSKWILTSSLTDQQIFEDSALIVDEGRIIAIIKQEELVEENYQKVEDFGNAIITSGFVNLGVQLQYNDLYKYKNKTFWGKLKRFVLNWRKFFSMLGVPVNTYPMELANIHKEYMCLNKKERMKSLQNGLNEIVKTGTTCIAQISNDDNFLDILKNSPLKAYIFFDLYSDSNKMSKKVFRKIRAKLENLNKNKSENIFFGVFPHSICCVHKRLWRILSKYARKHNILLMTKIVESQEEKDWLKYGYSNIDYVYNFMGLKKLSPQTKNMSAIEYLDNMKVLNKNVVVMNANHIEESELEILKDRQVQFAYAPRFCQKYFEKKQSFETVLKYFQTNAGFFTGDIINNSDYNILKELFSVNTTLPLEELIKYITIYPAKILRLDNMTGSLDVGKQADFNVFKLDKRETYINLREHLTPSEVYINGKKIISSQKSEQI